jgi:hypothetical protein
METMTKTDELSADLATLATFELQELPPIVAGNDWQEVVGCNGCNKCRS